MFKPKATPRELTKEERIAHHQKIAEDQLARAAKSGRLEALTLHATRATAHASLAVSYQLSGIAFTGATETEVEATD